MNPTTIALLILGGVGVMSAIAYTIQLFENRKKARQLQLMKLQAAIRRAHHLLTNFPTVLHSPEIIKFLSAYLTQRCQAALALEQSENTEKLLSESKAKAEVATDAPSHPEGVLTVFDSPNGAQRARAILKEFVKFLKEAESHGEINSSLSQPLIQQARNCFERAEIDIELHEAMVSEGVNDGKRSFNTYKKCFIRLSDLSKNHSLDRQLFELRNRMNTLAAYIEKKTEEERERRRQEEEEANKFGRL